MQLADPGRAQREATSPSAAGFVGVPRYVAPGCLQWRHPTQRSDLYSIGAVLYETLAGQPPYGTDVMEIAGNMRKGSLQPLPDAVPVDLRALVSGLIQLAPRKRLSREQALDLIRDADTADKEYMKALAASWHGSEQERRDAIQASSKSAAALKAAARKLANDYAQRDRRRLMRALNGPAAEQAIPEQAIPEQPAEPDPRTSEQQPAEPGNPSDHSRVTVRASMPFDDALLAALHERRGRAAGDLRVIDVALTESVLSFLEGIVPEYGFSGAVRQPAGSHLPTAAPTNAYRSQDGAWVLIAANSGPLFAKLAEVMGRPDLPANPDYADNPSRVANVAALDAEITAWTESLPAAEIFARLDTAGIPNSKIYDVADIAADRQYQAREMLRRVYDPAFGREMLHPAPMPRFDDSAPGGGIFWPGPEIGAHNAEVYGGLLGLPAETIAGLAGKGVI